MYIARPRTLLCSSPAKEVKLKLSDKASTIPLKNHPRKKENSPGGARGKPPFFQKIAAGKRGTSFFHKAKNG